MCGELPISKMFGQKVCALGLFLWFFLWTEFVCEAVRAQGVAAPAASTYTYSPDELRSIRDAAAICTPPPLDLPPELKRRKRGRRSGMRVKNRLRKFKPVLPSVIMGNVRSLANKVDELAGLLKYDRMFRQSSLLCFMESWLNDTIPMDYTDMDGFTIIRQDRDHVMTGKRTGGGVCLYVNEQWCHSGHITIKERVCDKNIELLAVSCRPYYLPREFSNVIVLVVYIPPSANAKLANDTIARAAHSLLSHTPDALIIINGDFNHCTLSSTLPSFKQFFYMSNKESQDYRFVLCQHQRQLHIHCSATTWQL